VADLIDDPPPVNPAAFVRAETIVATPPLVPEIRLHLATEITPLWQATEDVIARANLAPPYWAFAWPGGQALARYLLDGPLAVRGRQVLDFAAGSGIAGIAAAKSGARHVTATDLDRLALAAIAMNAALNGVAVSPSGDDLVDGAGPFEVILAGDVCYEQPMATRVWPWLLRCARRGARVYLADPGRAYLPKDGLAEVARYTVATTCELEDRETRETRVFLVDL
jgi:predicted nicotinamide N-methyase